MSTMPGCPSDFRQYWEAVDQELARYPFAAELQPLPQRTADAFTVYGLRLTSMGPYRIFGYYSVPTGLGPFPGLLRMPNYGSVNHVPPYEDRERYAVLQVMHRGQRLADQPYAAVYPGLLTDGIQSPDTYVYRGIVADCIRGLEFLLARPEVDATRVAVTGSDLALLAAARRPTVTAVSAAGLMFYRLSEARLRTDAYPVEEVNDYLRTFPAQAGAVAHTLSYFDPLHHAPQVSARTLLSVGDAGSLGAPEWLEPLRSNLGGPVEQYQLTHEGASDRDWIDAWISRHLDAEPKPMLWTVATSWV